MKQRKRNKLLSLFLSVIMVVTMIPVNVLTVSAAATHTVKIGSELNLRHGKIGIHWVNTEAADDEWFLPEDIPSGGATRTYDEADERMYVMFRADKGYRINHRAVSVYGDQIEDGKQTLIDHWADSSKEGDVYPPTGLGDYIIKIDLSVKPEEGKREVIVGNYNVPENGKIRLETGTGSLVKEFTQKGDCLVNEGESYNLFFIPEEGYGLDEANVQLVDWDTGDYSDVDLTYNSEKDCYAFTMPQGVSDDYEIRIDPTFKRENYTVTVSDSIEHGTVTADPLTAQFGDTITLTATPDSGYEFKSWNVTSASGGDVEVTDNKFSMPADNVTVTASFADIDYTHSIKIEPKRGEISVDKERAIPGELVTITILSIDEGCRVDPEQQKIKVKGENTYIQLTKVDETTYTFEMPDRDLDCVFTFFPYPNYPVCVNGTFITDVCKSGEGWSYEGDADGGTLTLNNADLTKMGSNNANIYIGVPVTIVLIGENKLSNGNFGISATSPVTIKGNGTLNTTGTGSGIEAQAGLTISDNANITVVGGTDGISVSNRPLSIINSTVDISGNPILGINAAHCDITVSGSNLNVAANTVGIYSASVEIKDKSTVMLSAGLCTSCSTVTITDSNVTATGTGSYGALYAIRNITINSGVVEATGKDYAISVDNGAITLGEGMRIKTPTLGVLSANGRNILEKDGTTLAKHAVIKAGFNIIVTDDGNGTGTATPLFDESGKTVALSATPNDSMNHRFKEWEVVSGGVTIADPYSADTSFVIGTADVEVKAIFEPLYHPAVVLYEDNNGSASFDKPAAGAGDKVTMTVVPQKGYAVTRVSSTLDDLDITDEGNNKYSFLMPAEDVTFYVWFEEVHTVTLEFGKGHEGFVKEHFGITQTFDYGYSNPVTVYAAKDGASSVEVQVIQKDSESARSDMEMMIREHLPDAKDGDLCQKGFIGRKASYESRREWLDDVNELWQVPLTDGATFYALWSEPAKLELTVIQPKCGVTVTQAGSGALVHTDPFLEISPSKGVVCMPHEEGGSWFEGEEFNQFFLGTFTGGEYYYGTFQLNPDFLYYISQDAFDNVVITNADLIKANYNSGSPYFKIKVQAVHVEKDPVVVDPTCTEPGSKTYNCAFCGEEVHEVIEATGHKWGDWKLTTPATVDKEGVETRYCSKCDASETRNTPKATPTATPTAAPIVKPTVKPTAKPSSVSLTLDKNKASVVCGKTATLKATLKGSTSKITWKSSDTKVATVDSNGKVKAKMAGSATITASAAGKSAKCVVTVLYKDVTNSKDFWYAPTNYLTAKGVVKGYDKQTKFKPENKCTRAQMVTFIWRLQGEPAPKAKTCKFKDVKKTDYFYKACIWGNENHIVEGYKDGTFGPQIVCARKHAVTFLWRLAKKPKPSSTKNKFKDVKKSDYFYTATLWASEKKILAGYDDGTFRPNGDCLRRQMVTFLYKYDKFVNGKG